jgi:hypothetical protein
MLRAKGRVLQDGRTNSIGAADVYTKECVGGVIILGDDEGECHHALLAAVVPIVVSAKQTFWVKARLSKPCWLVVGCYGRLIQSRMVQVSQIAQTLDIHGLIIYLAGMTFILGALVFANHADDQRDKIKRRVARASC